MINKYVNIYDIRFQFASFLTVLIRVFYFSDTELEMHFHVHGNHEQ